MLLVIINLVDDIPGPSQDELALFISDYHKSNESLVVFETFLF
jgi:hypothetical protein